MAARGNTWEVPAGESMAFTVVISNAGKAITGQYTGSEPLPAVVWAGSNLSPIAGMITPTWQDAANGKVAVVVAPPASATPGWYRVRLSVTYGGTTSPYYVGWLRVDAIPGTATEAPTYCSYQDLVDLAGDWVDRLMQGGSGDETNFLKERARARTWLDDIIIGNSRVFAYRFDLNYALYYGSFPFGPVESPDAVMASYLASDFLQVTGRTIECTAYKALAFICEKRQTFDESGEKYRERAAYYHRMASNSVRRYRPTLDTDGDGRADIAFNLGVITFR